MQLSFEMKRKRMMREDQEEYTRKSKSSLSSTGGQAGHLVFQSL